MYNASKFQLSNNYKRLSLISSVLGFLALLLGIFFLALSDDKVDRTRFWAVLLQNSTYFLMLANGAMFVICAVILSKGAWLTVMQRVPEAISAIVPVLSLVTLIVLFSIVFGGQDSIYHWLNLEHVHHDKILSWKSAFLNPGFFVAYSIITLILWSVLGWKMRYLSKSYAMQKLSYEQAKKHIFNTTIWAAIFMAVFTLTMASVIPWLWLLSIDAHWYSSIYSWYVLASVLCSVIALITIYVVYLQGKQCLPFVNKSHLHDLGKLLFAFSFFWAYLWYSQYMLVWYSDLPEETGYFKLRLTGGYVWLFYINFIANFIFPVLLLMARDTKRNRFYLLGVAVLVLFGHWLDFYLLVIPGPLKMHFTISWFELGILALFVGITMFLIGFKLKGRALTLSYAPFFRESMIQNT